MCWLELAPRKKGEVSTCERVSCAGFHDRDGQQYCQHCFLTLFASRCQGCSQPILENYISALNALWHPQCFVCRVSSSTQVKSSSLMLHVWEIHRFVWTVSHIRFPFLVQWGLCSSLFVGVLHPLCQRQLLRTRRQTSVRGPLPPVPWERVSCLPAANPGPLRHGHGGQVSPPPLCVSFLLETLEQRLLQRAGEQAILPPLLPQIVWLKIDQDILPFLLRGGG